MCDNFKHVALTRGIKKCIIICMRYAVITDVHSNIFALRAALFEIDKLHADKIICLGDIVGNGFYPDETVSLIRERGDIECVKGNHDLFANFDLSDYTGNDPRVKMFRWTRRVLSTASRKFLAGLPKMLKINDEGVTITAFHYPSTSKGRFKDMKYLPTDDEVRELFKGLRGDVFLFGHEHTGSLTEIDGKYYLNFGTLGNFLEKNVARYGILNIRDGKVSYELKRAEYDDTRALETTERLNDVLQCGTKEKVYRRK